MKFKYLIIDDEPLARKLIHAHASKIDALELAGQFGNAIEAAGWMRNKQVDLIFLDIQMPEITGLQFASTLKNPPAIVLTTAHRNFAPEAFDLEVTDYLLKPISFERFLKAVNKFFDLPREGQVMRQQSSPDSEFIYVRADRKMHKIYSDEIWYVESLDDYVKVHLKDRTLITRENITALDEKLPGTSFVRIHRSFIINAKWVRAIGHESITVNDRELPFGRAFKKSALHKLSITSGKRA